MSSSMPRPEAPTVHVDEGRKDQTRSTHPAFAQISAARVSCGIPGATLYGSDYHHHHLVQITITASELMRSLSRDWHMPGNEYIRVSMTEAQWAEFVSTLNAGSGPCCTLEHRAPGGTGWVPDIVLTVDRRDQFAKEVRDTVADALAQVDKLIARLDEAKVGASMKKELLGAARMARQEIEKNLPFVAKSFDEHMETATVRAKAEVHAFVQNAVHRAGLQALQGQVPFSLPPAGDE